MAIEIIWMVWVGPIFLSWYFVDWWDPIGFNIFWSLDWVNKILKSSNSTLHTLLIVWKIYIFLNLLVVWFILDFGTKCKFFSSIILLFSWMKLDY